LALKALQIFLPAHREFLTYCGCRWFSRSSWC